jgi:hypothetical protein
MPQILQTKNFGELEVEHGGWQDGSGGISGSTIHIVRLTNGVYCHSSGLPVQSKSEFAQAGMRGDDLLKAENWFDHRHDSEDNPPQGVVFRPDGSVAFEDGTPVTQSAQLMQCLPPGEFLDAALKALFKWQEGKKAPGLKNTRALEAAKKGPVAPKRKAAKKGKSLAVPPVTGQAATPPPG